MWKTTKFTTQEEKGKKITETITHCGVYLMFVEELHLNSWYMGCLVDVNCLCDSVHDSSPCQTYSRESQWMTMEWWNHWIELFFTEIFIRDEFSFLSFLRHERKKNSYALITSTSIEAVQLQSTLQRLSNKLQWVGYLHFLPKYDY